MPLELELPDDQESITLEQYVEYLERGRYDLSDEAQLIASAPYLKKLGNNRQFLMDHIFRELKNILQFQRRNSYAPEVLILHTTPRYFIRANIWKPITEAEVQIPGFRYDVCHDHNFDILTIGYLGPGYRCRSYTYDRRGYVGMLGEPIAMIPEGTFTLSQGKVALYRAKRDVHIQLPPEELSVSINLIPRGSAQNEMQFQFDESTGTICRYLDFSGAETVVRLAALLGGREQANVLERIANQHPSAKIRALALLSQMHIAPESADAVQKEMHLVQSPLIRHIVESELASYGASMRTLISG